jgi:sec-independent protein translocase protein TatB
MFNIGPEELLLILVIALIFVGPKRLPDMARQVGKGLREFRNITGSAKRELMDSVSVDLNAQPNLAEAGADMDGDDTPVDISSLPVWDGTTDQPQVPGVNAPAAAAAPSNGNGTKAAKQAAKPKKKKATADGAGATTAAAAAAAASVPASETEPVSGSDGDDAAASAPSIAEPAVPSDAQPSSEQTAPLDVDHPSADAAPVDGTNTTVPTTDPVEP